MTYANPSTINASLGLTEVLNYTNTVTNSWISNMILIAVYFIVLMGFYKSKGDFKGALAVSGYTTFVIALFFWIGGFVNPIALGMSIGVAILGTIVLLLDNN